jgi:hypothetical protein
VSEIRRIGIRMGIKKNENFDLDTSCENILLHPYLWNFGGMCLKSTLCKTIFFSKVSIATLVPSTQTVWSWLAERTRIAADPQQTGNIDNMQAIKAAAPNGQFPNQPRRSRARESDEQASLFLRKAYHLITNCPSHLGDLEEYQPPTNPKHTKYLTIR